MAIAKEDRVFLENSHFLMEYRKQAEGICSFAQGAPLDQEQLDRLDRLILENFGNKDVYILNSNDRDEMTQKRSSDLLTVLDETIEKKHFIAGNGTLFRNKCSDGNNAMGSFVLYILGKRDEVKGVMKQYLRAGDNETAAKYDIHQKVWKVLANGFYGATGQGSFIFYDLNTAPACTQTGFNLISNLIISFEQFFGNNWHYREYGDIYEYMDRVVSKPRMFSLSPEDIAPCTAEVVFERMHLNYPPDWVYKEDMEGYILERLQYLQETDPEALFRIYYANNLYAFLELDDIAALVQDALSEHIMSGNPDDIKDEAVKERLQNLFDAIDDFVAVECIFEEQLKFVDEREKNSVLLTDTDSTFLFFGPLLEYTERKLNYDTEVFENFVTVSSVFFYILSCLAHRLLMNWAERLNVADENKKYISLKNEFVFQKLFLTPNKKNYAYYVLSREGIILSESERFEIKGMQIKKSSTNKITRKYFQDLLHQKILKEKNVDIAAVLQSFIEYEQMIRDSIAAGRTEFGIPMRYSGADGYDSPYSQEVVRGTVVWNHFYPLEPVEVSDMAATFPTLGETREQFIAILENTQWKDKEHYQQAVDLGEYVFKKNEELAKRGFTRICVPSSTNCIPEYILPFIDLDRLIFKNMTAALIILETLGVYCIEARDNARFSNIVRF